MKYQDENNKIIVQKLVDELIKNTTNNVEKKKTIPRPK